MAETVKIKVDVEVVDLEVNDNGDTIKLPVSDERFNMKLYDFAEKVQKESEKLEALKDSEDIRELITASLAFHTMTKSEFNILFGDLAYEKVFGEDIVVSGEYILEFLEQCLPIIEKYGKKRLDKLTKYNANRVGSSL